MLEGRIAAAPISWGVCEVPGWGLMLPTSRVLPEMTSLGLTATELGAPGFFPDDKDAIKAELTAAGMTLVGGFVPLVLQDRSQWADSLERARQWADTLAACGADRFVTALVQDYDWSRPTPPDRDTMKVIADGMRQVDEVCESFGIMQAFHPHVGTLVETAADIDLALDEVTSKWTLDTGHFAIGGYDPVRFAQEHADRVGHVHLKDVNMSLASQVLSGEISLIKAVQDGIFVPLGTGDVDIAAAVVALESAGYTGRYVLEQDCAIMGAAPAQGEGPLSDVRTCLDYLAREVEPRLATVTV